MKRKNMTKQEVCKVLNRVNPESIPPCAVCEDSSEIHLFDGVFVCRNHYEQIKSTVARNVRIETNINKVALRVGIKTKINIFDMNAEPSDFRDALKLKLRKFKLAKYPKCMICGEEHPSIMICEDGYVCENHYRRLTRVVGARLAVETEFEDTVESRPANAPGDGSVIVRNNNDVMYRLSDMPGSKSLN